MPSEGWKNGSTRAWRKTRAYVLKRDGGKCQVGLDGCTYIATCVHHTHGRATTGDDPKYLVASCQHCNQAIGDPSAADPAPTPRTAW